MPLAQGPDVEYRFNDVRVDTRAHSVTRSGVELALEPKAYGVLLQLLARPGAVFARDDLLDAVWGHRHVTPAVLNRVIAMLRRELGDEADHPNTIRTVHGVGYAFIAPVTTAAAPDTSATPSEVKVATRDVPVEAAVKPEFDVVPVNDEVVAPAAVLANAASSGAAARAHMRAASPRNKVLLVAAAIAAALALAWSWWPETQQPIPAQVNAPAQTRDRAAQAVTLAVLPFTSVGEDDKLRELAGGLTDSFGEALARLADVRVTAAESTAVAVAAAPEPQAVARALSVGHVLGGRLRAIDPANIELQLTLYTPESREPTWSHLVRHARAQPFRILGPALDAIAASPLRGLDAARADPVLNAALDAQDLYWLARQSLAKRDYDAFRRALVLFERAVVVDPGFALAWTGISASHRLMAIAGQEPLQASAQKASAAIERALALDPNLMQAYIEKAMISTMQWRSIEGRAAAQRAMELAPNHPNVLYINGNIESYLGRPRAAYALHLRARAGNPLSQGPETKLAQDCMMLGDEACARARFEEARRLPEYDFQLHDAQQRLNLAFGQLGAVTSAQPIEASSSTQYTVLGLAQAWSMLGFDEESARTLARLEAPRSAVPMHLTVHLDRHWRKARWAEALAWAEGAGGNATQEPWRSIWTAQARVLAGNAAAGLRDYDRTFADRTNRALVTHSWFYTRFGIGQIANWIALRRQAGASYQAELAAMNADIAAMIEGGVDVPALDYHRAAAAALAGDTAAADARLGRAIERGWLEDVAFATDFVWRDFATAPWLEARRAQIRTRLASERALAWAAVPVATTIKR